KAVFVTRVSRKHFISVSHKDKRPPHIPSPHPPPKIPISKRAYVKFNDPPDVTNGIMVFWETPSNKTIIVGQFSSGFTEGDEKEYTFKVYNETSELVDLKPENDTFDKLFKIRSNGSTDSFLFALDTPLVTGNNSVVGNYLVIGRPGYLLGYKLHYDKKNVYIIEMAYTSHEDVISYLQDCFKEPNNKLVIKIQKFPIDHYNPIGIGEKITPDIAVRPRECLVQRASPYPDFPRGDFKSNSHARIICEVANIQKIDLWNTRCETWMHEEYVRCVLGVKIYPKININRIVHQPIIARLWVRQALPGGILSSNTTLAENGIYVKEWECGTIHHNTHAPTGCNAPNNNEFQVTIPVRDAFWDPPILGRVPNVEGYTAVVPNTVVGENFVIDLYDIQQIVLNVN
ncbi:13498_t:CDS:2, partial [Cetraspora pellucida]